jgi:hypothetical protein
MAGLGLGCVKTRRHCICNRRSHSSKTVSGIQSENAFDLEIELKNVILVAFRFFAFLRNQGHSRRFRNVGAGWLYSQEPTVPVGSVTSEKCRDWKSSFDHIVGFGVLNNKALCPNGLNSFCLGFGVFC